MTKNSRLRMVIAVLSCSGVMAQVPPTMPAPNPNITALATEAHDVALMQPYCLGEFR